MVDPCLIRRALPDDLAAIAAIEHAVFTDPWSVGGLRSVLAAPAVRTLVAERDGSVVGYVISQLVLDDVEIQNLAVTPTYRRRGIGRMLVARAISDGVARGARRVSLEVRESNAVALRLYTALGFRPAARRKDYYRRPREDAIVLVREIAPKRVSSIDKRT